MAATAAAKVAEVREITRYDWRLVSVAHCPCDGKELGVTIFRESHITISI